MGICHDEVDYSKIIINKKKLIDNNDNNYYVPYNNINNNYNKLENNNYHITQNHMMKYLNNLVNDYNITFYYENSFIIFKLFDNEIFILVYGNKNGSIISYNISDNKKMNEINKAHLSIITNFRHYFDSINKRDLIISSSYDINIKLWNYTNLECLFNISNIYKKSIIYSICFLNDKNNIYILTSSFGFVNRINQEKIKVFDLKGKLIKVINDSSDNTIFIDNYYDKKMSKNYIITGNHGCVKSFVFENNKLYFKYNNDENNNKYYHFDIIIHDKGKTIKLFESSENGIIRIWNFHTGELIKKIKVFEDCELYSISFWNNLYLLVSCANGNIKLIDFKKGKIFKIIKFKGSVLSIKNIFHPKYGNCLISLIKDENLKLLSYEMNFFDLIKRD